MARIYVPGGPREMGWRFSNVQTARPAAALGGTCTPGNGAKGSYGTALISGAQMVTDGFGILIGFNSVAVSALAKDCMVDIGIDPAGGTDYQVIIPNLLASSAAPYTNAGNGIWYFFPLFIKAGSSIAARAQVNNATVGTVNTIIEVYGRPRDHRSVKVGTKVVAYGIVGNTTTYGTAVTSGTTSEGAWTLLGTTGATERPWYWQQGFGINQATQTAMVFCLDLGVGDATNKRVVIQDQPWTIVGTTEQVTNIPEAGPTGSGTAGSVNVYGRMQCSATPLTGISMAAYGLIG